jgi:hypothetical protein
MWWEEAVVTCLQNCRVIFLEGLRNPRYSGRRITLSFSYVTERGEGKMERAGGEQD